MSREGPLLTDLTMDEYLDGHNSRKIILIIYTSIMSRYTHICYVDFESITNHFHGLVNFLIVLIATLVPRMMIFSSFFSVVLVV